jgi:hypothetical protein
MAYDPTLLLVAFDVLAVGLLGLVLRVVGLSWFVTHPKETGESFRRGKRQSMLALPVVGISFIGISVLPFVPPPF